MQAVRAADSRGRRLSYEGLWVCQAPQHVESASPSVRHVEDGQRAPSVKDLLRDSEASGFRLASEGPDEQPVGCTLTARALARIRGWGTLAPRSAGVFLEIPGYFGPCPGCSVFADAWKRLECERSQGHPVLVQLGLGSCLESPLWVTWELVYWCLLHTDPLHADSHTPGCSPWLPATSPRRPMSDMQCQCLRRTRPDSFLGCTCLSPTRLGGRTAPPPDSDSSGSLINMPETQQYVREEGGWCPEGITCVGDGKSRGRVNPEPSDEI